MRTFIFAERNFKEIIRDILSLIFCILLPIVMLLFFQLINKSVPNQYFVIKNMTPGIIVFSFTFLTLFSAILISKDRNTSFLTRLYSSPMKPREFVFGYIIPIFPIAILQILVLVVVSILFGLRISINTLSMIAFSIPVIFIFIGFGMLVGFLFNDKAVGGVSSIIINAAAFLGGMWFDIDQIGGFYKKLCNVLPFARSTELLKKCIYGDYTNLWIPLLIVSAYAILINLISILVFRKKMYLNKK